MVSPCSSEKALGSTSSTPGVFLRGKGVLRLLVPHVAQPRLRHRLGCTATRWPPAPPARMASIIRLRVSSGSITSSRCATAAARHRAVDVGEYSFAQGPRRAAGAAPQVPRRPAQQRLQVVGSSAPARRSVVCHPPCWPYHSAFRPRSRFHPRLLRLATAPRPPSSMVSTMATTSVSIGRSSVRVVHRQELPCVRSTSCPRSAPTMSSATRYSPLPAPLWSQSSTSRHRAPPPCRFSGWPPPSRAPAPGSLRRPAPPLHR